MARVCLVDEHNSVGTERWVSEYDYPARTVTLTLAAPGTDMMHWVGIERDERLSDPEERFLVFGARGKEAESLTTVKVVVELTEDGSLKACHPDFNADLIGSLTIWPYKVAGERFRLDHWIWWSEGPIWDAAEPRAWISGA